MSFLRASGGVSRLYRMLTANFSFSPRKRRCFRIRRKLIADGYVFSAQAEVFLYGSKISGFMVRFLRASGGVSKVLKRGRPKQLFSPRKRRCFFSCWRPWLGWSVFSAQAEVFLIKNTSVVFQQRFLRASGGVSLLSARLLRMAWFSPRKRRCFYHSVLAMCSVYVFSAQAEVFL